ncbi:hypothetical protein [Pseudooceanicola sp.]|uniref:hypothetical protein n=1 Tax=Pseudooceanicola sp. TaxID=1914328 RepID=UPI00262741AF|nr:hypothetical protein [Pseudooceanicola sp.]MDF1856221.1 hypothetical protein [Pseudooceanicola sp.]
MHMLSSFTFANRLLDRQSFAADETGAVTVDWVVLCALVVALTVLALQMMTTGTTGLTDSTASYMTDMVKN